MGLRPEKEQRNEIGKHIPVSGIDSPLHAAASSVRKPPRDPHAPTPLPM
jgi:hypothetical protein